MAPRYQTKGDGMECFHAQQHKRRRRARCSVFTGPSILALLHAEKPSSLLYAAVVGEKRTDPPCSCSSSPFAVTCRAQQGSPSPQQSSSQAATAHWSELASSPAACTPARRACPHTYYTLFGAFGTTTIWISSSIPYPSCTFSLMNIIYIYNKQK